MRRNIFVSLGVVALAFILILVSCRKINLATDVGQGLIPEVDNIHTFDTTLEVQTFNNIFTAATDSFNSLGSDEQFLGLIDNDPIFGKTDARMYFQTLPSSKSKDFLKNVPSKRYLDSVVLYVDYVETYGDSLMPQTIQVSEISPSFNFKFTPNRDSAFSIRYNGFTTTNILGTKTIIPATLKDSVLIPPDTLKTARLLSIKLDQALGERLLSLDSASIANDTLFKQQLNGFALQSINGGNAALGFDLLGAKTKLSVYYRYDNLTTANDQDTTVANFVLMGTAAAASNYIGRDYSGTQIAATSGDNVHDDVTYVQNVPGTYSLLKIPGLADLSNRIIHLAELKAESIFDASDAMFAPPKLFIDALSTSGKNYNLPYVFNDFTSNTEGGYGISSTGMALFGVDSILKRDASNQSISEWRFNLTRYVQNVVNGKKVSADLRLYAKPFFVISDTMEYRSIDNNFVQSPIRIPVAISQSRVSSSMISPLIGRVRLGGGSHPTQQMKLRIVYSKL